MSELDSTEGDALERSGSKAYLGWRSGGRVTIVRDVLIDKNSAWWEAVGTLQNAELLNVRAREDLEDE